MPKRPPRTTPWPMKFVALPIKRFIELACVISVTQPARPIHLKSALPRRPYAYVTKPTSFDLAPPENPCCVEPAKPKPVRE
jgi:hypothetical protein